MLLLWTYDIGEFHPARLFPPPTCLRETEVGERGDEGGLPPSELNGGTPLPSPPPFCLRSWLVHSWTDDVCNKLALSLFSLFPCPPTRPPQEEEEVLKSRKEKPIEDGLEL